MGSRSVGIILRVDLSKGKIVKQMLNSEFVCSYLGGRGLNLKLLYDELKRRADPFGADNQLYFGTGPCNGTVAPGTRLELTTKSPLTGYLGRGNIGGAFAAELKFAGYDTLAFQGKAEEPKYLWIDDGQVELRDAEHLWGKTTWETEKMVKEDVGDPDVSVLPIGPAGENLVRFANLVAERGARSGGRGGIGAVMGCKNLKAVAVRGTGGVRVADNDLLEKTVQDIEDFLGNIETCYTGLNYVDYHFIYGTSCEVNYAEEELGVLSTRNYQTGTLRRRQNTFTRMR